MLLHASGSDAIRSLVETAPVSRQVVRRYVPGTDPLDAVRASEELLAQGLTTTLDHLGEDTTDPEHARAVRDAYVTVLRLLAEVGLTQGGRVEVSVKLSAVGQALGADGEKIALDNARAICEAAAAAGTTVTLDMEDHTTTDSTLAVLRELRADFPWTGAVLQAYLHRTEADCRDLADAGLAGAAVQGRLQGAGVRRVPGRRRGRPVLRALPEGAHGRPRATRWSPPTTRAWSPSPARSP